MDINAVNKILKLLDKGTYKVGRHEFLSDVFQCLAIAVANGCEILPNTRQKSREETYKRIIRSYDKDMQNLICEISGEIIGMLLTQTESGDYGDYLGELYMRSETSSKHSGQFFTPYHISQAMARLCIDVPAAMKRMENNKIVTMCEPSCGSCGTIIAAAEILNASGFNTVQNLYVEASDIDARCVHMSYLQLSFLGIPAVIYHRDSLTMQTWDRWDTPALAMQWIRFRKVVNGIGVNG